MILKRLFLIVCCILTFYLNAQKPFIEVSKILENTYSWEKKSTFYNKELYTISFHNSVDEVFLNLTIRDTIGNIRFEQNYLVGNNSTPIQSTISIINTKFTVSEGNLYLTGMYGGGLQLNVSNDLNLHNNNNNFLLFISASSIENNSNSIDYISYLLSYENSHVLINGWNLTSNKITSMNIENGNVYLVYETFLTDLYTSNNTFFSGIKSIYIQKISASCINNDMNFQNDSESFSSYFSSFNNYQDYVKEVKIKEGNIHFLVNDYLNNEYFLYKIKKSTIDTQTSLDLLGSYASFSLPEIPSNSFESYDFLNNQVYILLNINSSIPFNTSVGVTSTTGYDPFLLVLSEQDLDLSSNNYTYLSKIDDFELESSFLKNITFFDNHLYYSGDITDENLNGLGYFKKIPLSLIEANQNISLSNQVLTVLLNTYPNNDFYSGNSTIDNLSVNNYGIHIAAILYSNDYFNYPPNNNTLMPDSSSYFSMYLNFCLNGNLNYSTSILSHENLYVKDNNIYFSGFWSFGNYQIFTTPNQNPYLIFEIANYSKISIDTNNYLNLNITDTLSPSVQNLCTFSTPELIKGDKFLIENELIPIIYQNIIGAIDQKAYLKYYWEKANNSNGPWSRVAGAYLKDYLPIVQNQDQFYRRITYYIICGDTLTYSISDVSSIILNEFVAPTVDAGNNFYTCPNDAITIGGNPTAQGGTEPYTYNWDNNLESIANPSFNLHENSIVTLTVIDANGCIKKDQAVIHVFKALAGNDRSVCNGEEILIGDLPIQGIPNVSYSWTPPQNLSCPTCSQTYANPPTETSYYLILSLQNSDGDFCTTLDTVFIQVNSGPTDSNFAGQDLTICYGTNPTIGTPSENGFDYQWHSTTYLSSYNTSTTTFYSYPSMEILNENNSNPVNKYLVAEKNGCEYIDEIEISIIKAIAGLDLCGPCTIGYPDLTPNINETYQWTKISGPATFLGPTNQNYANVSDSPGENSIFELTVTHNGVSCSDQVTVRDCLIGNCHGFCDIQVEAEAECPSTLLDTGQVNLIAGTEENENLIYSWYPQTGLSNYNTQTVTLLTTEHLFYKVIVTSLIDPLFNCIDSIEVNNPTWQIPVFPVVDTTICLGQQIYIGNIFIPAYSYLWKLNGNFYSNESDPLFFPSNIGLYDFYLKVKDSLTGCAFKSYPKVTVETVDITESEDWYACSNSIIQLGNNSTSDYSNSWQPSNSPWQNGTSNTSVLPEVILTNTTTFINTITNNAGCSVKDTVTVYIDQFPTLIPIADKYICLGDDGLQIGNPAMNGLVYSWSPPDGLSCTNCAQPNVQHLQDQILYNLHIELIGDCGISLEDDMIVEQSNYPFSLPDITYCPSDGPVNLAEGIQLNYQTYSWSPSNFVSNEQILNTSTNVMSTTIFYLTASDNRNCIYTDTLVVVPTVSSGNAGIDRIMCLEDGNITIGDINNNGNFTWIPSSNISDPNSPAPLFTPTSSGVFEYTLVNSIGNCSASDELTITVNEVQIDETNNFYVCSNSCLNIGIESNPNYTYLWYPTLGLNNSSVSNPLACINDDIEYTLSVFSSEGCSKSQAVNVTVSDSLSPTIILPEYVVCLDFSTFNIDANVLPNQGNYQIYWTPSLGLSNPNGLNTELLTVFAQTNNYELNVINLDNGCSTISELNVDIIDCSLDTLCNIPFTILIEDDSICNNSMVNITFTSDSTDVIYHWTASGVNAMGFSDGFGSSISQNLQTITNAIGEVTYVITPYYGICHGDTQSITVFILPNPSVNLLTEPLSNCGPIQINLNTDNINNACLWTINNITYSDCQATILLENEGCYDLSLSVTDANFCSSNFLYDDYFCILETPTSSFNVNSNSDLWINSPVTFDNNSQNATNYIWMFNNGQDNVFIDNLSSQTVEFNQVNNYIIGLVAIDSQTGCQDTSFQTIYIQSYESVKDCNTNVFTPNNDNINDVFYLDFCGLKVKDIKFKIFNRWGNLMKEINEPYDYSNPNSYWDGTSDGKKCSEGTYFYVYEISTINDTKISDHGYITLINK
ncbi:MAG: gliding motility-associated C-terminal domain-containing protein [Flavobacteriia bacterium]|nr:gliding motility-associated C-terminal domain-containing protein [Flavobacteriia bacterium]